MKTPDVKNDRSGTWMSRIRATLVLVLFGFASAPGNVTAVEIYWSQNGGVWRAPSDDATPLLFTQAFDVRDIDLSVDSLFWSDVEPRVPITPTGVVRGMALDSSSRRDVARDLPSPGGLAIDNLSRKIVWSDLQQHSIAIANLDGLSGADKVLADVPSITQIHDLAIDPFDHKIYFGYVNPLIDGLFPGAIARMNEDGTELETIVSGLSEPWGIAIDLTVGTVYWSDVLSGRGGVIRRANLDGSDVLDVVDGLLDPRGVAVDTQTEQIYWADFAAGKIQRSNFGGGDTVDLFSQLDRPQGLALYWRPDFNGDGILDVVDINVLSSAVASGVSEPRLDINDDGFVNLADVELWIRDLRHTWFGDANIDGEFNSTDLVEVFVAGRYETGLVATWEQGDWNADASFNTSDFVLAFQDGGYEVGLRAEAVASLVEGAGGGAASARGAGPFWSAVLPEPSSVALSAVALICLLGIRRHL